MVSLYEDINLQYYTTPYVQRDPRTSLVFKQTYIYLIILTMTLSIVLLSGWFVQNCEIFENTTAQQWYSTAKYFMYIFLPLSVLWLSFSVMFAIRWQWAWMTITFHPPRKYGEDIEDLHPGILSRSGHALAMDANQIGMQSEQEAFRAYAL